jgi:hypothetical protein
MNHVDPWHRRRLRRLLGGETSYFLGSRAMKTAQPRRKSTLKVDGFFDGFWFP